MLWLVAALLALALAVSALAAVRLRTASRQLARCRAWPCVTGRIIESAVRRVSIHGLGHQYTPVVRYRYVVGGTHYEGESLTISSLLPYSRRRSAERRIARYAAGVVVQVHVDPVGPTFAVLECRAPGMTMLWTMIALLWIVIFGGIGALLLTPGVIGLEPVIRL
jgi:hypothetical protein